LGKFGRRGKEGGKGQDIEGERESDDGDVVDD